MPTRLKIFVTFWFLASLWALQTSAQTQTSTQQSADEVLRINTELVQTDVMVFDRRGRFVHDLKPEQFVLSVNGEPKKISSFEQFAAGTKSEATLPNANGSPSIGPDRKVSLQPGRLIFFFVDDLHLNAESLTRARKALLHFVDQQLNAEDRVAIISSSGQIGFLQQLTDNSAVLHEAIARLAYKWNPEAAGTTRISEYVASRIEDAGDRSLFAYLMESVKLEYGMGMGALRGAHNNDSAGQAARLLKSRIGQINAQSKVTNANTLEALRGVMQSATNLPGRKLVFFLSDGFIVDPRGSNALSLVHEATRIAARTGAVVYSIDMRGTFLDSSVDAMNNDYVDMTSRHAGVELGETTEPREPLNVLADETGGRLIINSTDLDKDLEQAVTESSDYYLLAWKPDSENERSGKARLEISIAGRSDLKVRLRRTYYVNEPAVAKSKSSSTQISTPETELLSALGSAQPVRSLPLSLSAGFVRKSETESILDASMQLSHDAFEFNSAADKKELDVIGAAIDDRGLIYTFKQILRVSPQPDNEAARPVIWHQQLNVRPGLYQVRVAVRDRATGRTASAMEWIEIPKAGTPRLAMSSLFLGERKVAAGARTDKPESVPVEVDRRFARTSVLRFQTYVYNASRAAGPPDVWIDARVMRGTQPVIVVAPTRVPPDLSKEPWLLPYWSEIALAQLQPGSYTLEVSATDRNRGSISASQKISFSVE